MITFDRGSSRFNFRSVAVFISEGHVLLHKMESDSFWSLPGGRVEFFEFSSETVVREMEEELGIKVSVIRPLWHMEQHFEYENKQYYEIGNYYLTEPAEPNTLPGVSETFEGIEDTGKLIFKWFRIEDLDDIVIKPELLTEKLKSLPETPEFIQNSCLRQE